MLFKKHLLIHDKKIFYHFLLNVLLVSTVSVFFLATVIFQYMKNSLLSDINKINTTELLVTSTTYQNYVENFQQICMALYQDSNIKSIMLSGDTEWTPMYSKAVSQIQNTIRINKHINSVYIFHANKIVLNVGNALEDSISQEKLIQLISSKKLISSEPIIWDATTPTRKTIPTLTIVLCEKISKENIIDEAIIVNIDLNMLQKSLFENDVDLSQHITLVDSDGSIIIASPNSKNSYLDQYLSQIISSEKTKETFHFSSDNCDLLVSYVKAVDENFYAISEMNYQSSISELTHAKNLLLIIISCVLLGIFILSFFVSYITYRPVNMVFAELHKLSHDSEEDKNNLSDNIQIKDSLSRIANKIDMLKTQTLKNQMNYILTTPRVSETLSSDFWTKSGILSFHNAPYILIVFRIHDYNMFLEQISTGTPSFQTSFICSLSAEKMGSISLCNAYPVTKDCVVLILSQKDQDSNLDLDKILFLAHDLQNIFRMSLNLDLSIGISSRKSDIHCLYNVYTDIYKMTNAKVFYPSGNIFLPDTVYKNDTSILIKNMDLLLTDAKNGNSDAFLLSLKQFIVLCQEYPYEIALQVLSKLAISLQTITNEIASISSNNNTYGKIYAEISNTFDYSSLVNRFYSICRDVSIAIGNANNKRTYDIIADALSYISENYNDVTLSTSKLASEFLISTGYFSRIFNEVTGCSFPDYLTKLRLENAKEMLKNKNMTINEIAEAVGYSSSSYFSSSFKKFYGISPSKYRMANISNSWMEDDEILFPPSKTSN